MPGRIGFDPATADHSTAQYRVGELFHQEGKWYRYIKNIDLDSADGEVAHMNLATGVWETTTDVSASLSTGAGQQIGVGVHVGVITAGNYGFIQVSGVHTGVKCADGSTTFGIGDQVMPHATVDGEINIWDDADEPGPIGVSLTAVTSGSPTTAAIWLKGLI